MDRCVTILVTVYNIAKYLDRFFQCLSAQTYRDYEALIVDDGSSDDSLRVCREHAEGDDRIRVLTTEHVGISAARAMAIANIRTDYVTSLDGDDYFEPDYLRHLMAAQEKYGADLVISNVIYYREDGTEISRLAPRAEGFYSGASRTEVLPALLTEERLNYLYGKLYKGEYMRKVTIEPGVLQGSDTMINFRYLAQSRSVAVIEDYDYHYIRYTSRSVTSYSGRDFYTRLCRINTFLYDICGENGWLTDEMLRAIDTRILLTGRQAIYRIMAAPLSFGEKEEQVRTVIRSDEYTAAYLRREQAGDIGTLGFEVVVPGEEEKLMRHIEEVYAAQRRDEAMERRRARYPGWLKKLRQKLRP